jgi:hypothetical protein
MKNKDTTMQPILQLVANLQQTKYNNKQKEHSETKNQTDDSITPQSLSNEGILFIWKKMTAIYGDQWVSRRGPSHDLNGTISSTAKEWSESLGVLTPQQIKSGFKAMDKNLDIWPPNLYQFKTYCLSSNLEGVPSVNEVYEILSYKNRKRGSVKDRYKHPLVFSISKLVNMATVRDGYGDGDKKEAISAITSAYNRLIQEGWPDWEPEHLVNHKLLEQKPTEEEKAQKLDQRKKGFESLREQIRIR